MPRNALKVLFPAAMIVLLGAVLAVSLQPGPVMAFDANNYTNRSDTKFNKTTGAILIEPIDYVLSGSYRCMFDPNSRRALDPNFATGLTLPTNLVRIGLVPESGTSGTIRWQMGNAADANAYATSPEWPASGIGSTPVNWADANGIRFRSSAGVIYATLYVFTPR